MQLNAIKCNQMQLNSSERVRCLAVQQKEAEECYIFGPGFTTTSRSRDPMGSVPIPPLNCQVAILKEYFITSPAASRHDGKLTRRIISKKQIMYKA